MASISDIFDWLNQGAQGDIPGTGGSQPSVQLAGDLYGFGPGDQNQYSQPSPRPWPQNAPYPWDMYSGQRDGPPVDYSYPPARSMKPANEASADGGVQEAAATPQDYTGMLTPDLLGHYNALVQAGVPPSMAHMILTQGGGQLQSSQQPRRQSSQKQGGQQQSGAYELGHMAGSGLHSLLFGPSSQQSQQDGQSQGHQGLIHMLTNWFSPSSGASDYDTGGL